jgi:3',5'-cyclic AMP phosphodiesterase CpdA
VRLAHVSDLHVGAHDDLALDGLAEDLHAANVAATIVTGDLTMRARRHEFVRVRQAMQGFPQPIMVVLGNHDIPLTNPVRRLTEPYARYQAQVAAELDPLLDLGAVRVQGLGSMPRWRWKSGHVSQRQADVIRAAFADAPPGTARVVALHHPLSSSGLESLAGGGELADALVDAEVDLVLAGHTHVPAVRTLHLGPSERDRAVVEVIAGTATSHRTRGVGRSWSLLEVAVDSVTVTVHRARSRQWLADAPQVLPLSTGGHRPPGPESGAVPG